MSALTKDTVRVYELGDINELPVKAGVNIYQGAALGCDITGYAKPLQFGDSFVGFAEEPANNFDGSDGNKNIRFKKRGTILLEIPNVALTDNNKPVYATNDNSFTLSETNAVYIGKISRIESSGFAVVEFNAANNPPAVS